MNKHRTGYAMLIAFFLTFFSFTVGADAQIANEPVESIETQAPWWGSKFSIYFGSYGGMTCGIMGVVIGILGGLCIMRRLLFTLLWFNISTGVIIFIIGLVALTQKQPYHVYYPCLLLGVISPFVCGVIYYSAKKRYEAKELRKMESLDIS